jgi:ABC-2 type transport system permease protein
MPATLTIAKRELGAYFKSPVAYIVLTAFVAINLFLFFDSFFLAGSASLESFFGGMPFLFLFFGPAMSMRLLAEERGSGTIELLLTMPVRDSEVVIGKFLAALGLFLVGLGLTLPVVYTVAELGPLDVGATLAGYVGAAFLGATYLAVGLFASALTKNQIVAFIVGLAICLGLYLLGVFFQGGGSTVGPVLQYLSPAFHFQKIARGVIELKNVVYYLSLIAALLLLATQVLESRKWR